MFDRSTVPAPRSRTDAPTTPAPACTASTAPDAVAALVWSASLLSDTQTLRRHDGPALAIVYAQESVL